MNHNDFIDILVARSPTDDVSWRPPRDNPACAERHQQALVDVMFALLVHFVFESAK